MEKEGIGEFLVKLLFSNQFCSSFLGYSKTVQMYCARFKFFWHFQQELRIKSLLTYLESQKRPICKLVFVDFSKTNEPIGII